jgi:hypothetical protein
VPDYLSQFRFAGSALRRITIHAERTGARNPARLLSTGNVCMSLVCMINLSFISFHVEVSVC